MSEWIRVDERLPSVSSNVLCVGVDSEGEFLAPVAATLHEDGKFICGYKFGGDRVVGFYVETLPTHWMPMPNPPKGEVADD